MTSTPNDDESARQTAHLLGKIEATLTGTAEDVRAIRTDLSDQARRLATVEQQVGAIEAERAVLMPQYRSFKHGTNNELQILHGKFAKLEGQVDGATKITKALWAVGGAFGASILAFGPDIIHRIAG